MGLIHVSLGGIYTMIQAQETVKLSIPIGQELEIEPKVFKLGSIQNLLKWTTWI